MEEVNLIASGYEWICPHCETLNEEIEIPSDGLLECQNDECREISQLSEYHHALE